MDRLRGAKPRGKGVGKIRALLDSHKKSEEEFYAVMATLQSHLTNYIGLEKTPTVTEDRLHFLKSKVSNLKNVMTAEAFLSAFGPYQALRLTAQMVANCVYKLHQLLTTIHADNYLRIFAELAHNLEVNLADIIILEHLLVNKWHAARPESAGPAEDFDADDDRLPFPSLLLLVAFVLVTPIPTLNHVLHTQIEPQPKHGSPPTFGKMLMTALAEPDWTTLINWVGTLSVLLAMPMWFPRLSHPSHAQVPLEFAQQDKALCAIAAGVAEFHDVAQEDEEVELRNQAILLAANRAKGKKGGKRGMGKEGGAAKEVRMVIASAMPAVKMVINSVTWKVPLFLDGGGGATSAAAAAAAASAAAAGKLGDVYDLSSLITCPPRQPRARELHGMISLGGAARATSRLAVVGDEDRFCMFAPFSTFVRSSGPGGAGAGAGKDDAAKTYGSKAQPSRGGAKAAKAGAGAAAAAVTSSPFTQRRTSLPEGLLPPPKEADTVDWLGSIYKAGLWSDGGKKAAADPDEAAVTTAATEEGAAGVAEGSGDAGGAEEEAKEKEREQEVKKEASAALGKAEDRFGKGSTLKSRESENRHSSAPKEREGKANTRINRNDTSEEDDKTMATFLRCVMTYVEKADEASERLHNRLHQKLREPFCCTRHIYEQLKYFCPEQRAVICEQCTKERYAGMAVVALPTHCAGEIQRLSTKEDELRILVKAASDLAKAVPVEKNNLHTHVDSEVDSLIAALNERREHLHKDIDRRAAVETAAIERETAICLREKRTLEDAMLVLDGLATGQTTVVAASNPLGAVLRQEATYSQFWKMAHIRLHRPMGIATGLKLLLPVEELMKDAERLEWSVPKQYLSNRMYPPVSSACPTLPSMIRSFSTLKQKNRGYARRAPAVKNNAEVRWKQQQQDEGRRVTHELAGSLESVWGLVHCLRWRSALRQLMLENAVLCRTIIQSGGHSLPRYGELFERYKEILQAALRSHIAEGKYVPSKHGMLMTHEEIRENLRVLPPEERQRLIVVDTMEAARSIPDFTRFVSNYWAVYAPGVLLSAEQILPSRQGVGGPRLRDGVLGAVRPFSAVVLGDPVA